MGKANHRVRRKELAGAIRSGSIPEDKLSLHLPPYIKLAANRSVDYVWEYYQENLPKLIIKAEQ